MRSRNLILPAVLIAVGILALLVNLGAIPTDRLYRLADLWPALLIVLGVVLLVNRARLPAPAEAIAEALIVIVALVGAGAYVALGPAIPVGTHQMTVSEPAGDFKEATLELDVGSATVNVQGSSSMASDLVQAQITYSGPEPTVTFDSASGRVVVQQNSRFGFFGPQEFRMDVQLNTTVKWSFAFHSGSSRDTFDIPTVNVGSMEIDTGASTENISLGVPQGHVSVRINGGALTVHLHRRDGAASVKVSGGAVSLTFDGDTSTAVGSVSHSTGPADDIFEVAVSGGTCSVTMDKGSGLD